MLGPFLFDKQSIEAPNAEEMPIGLSRDYLTDFGQNERSIDAAAFVNLDTSKSDVRLGSRFGNRRLATTPINNILQLSKHDSTLNYAVAYLAVEIESPSDRDIAIAAGVDDNMRLWLNHELLFADLNNSDHGLTKFQRVIGGKLKKGSNFLLVKAGNLEDDWQLIVTLYPHERALTLALENAVNPILASSVISAGREVQLRRDLFPQSSPAPKYSISDAHHKVVALVSASYGRTVKDALGTLRTNNLYFCSTSVAGKTLEMPFYYGDLAAEYSRLAREVSAVHKTDLVEVALQAQLTRLRHLLLPASRRSEFWDQKVAASIAELEANLVTLRKGNAAFRHAAGTHLRGYRSTVDGQIQHYWIHMPYKALRTGRPIPLVIAMPYIAGRRPFLESYFLAAFDETENYRMLGNDYGFAVLQIWGRGDYVGGTAIATSDVFDAVAAVRRDYLIDLSRIYVLGYCEGGRLALLLGERYPNRFAAIATEGPITIQRGTTPWDEYSSPIAAAGSLAKTPVFITHDKADTTPFQDSVSFVSRCREAGVNITLVQRAGGGSEHGFDQNPMAVKRSLFEFFRGKSLGATRSPSTRSNMGSNVTSRRFGVGQGPIEDAFGEPILIVEGTLGTSAQHVIVRQLVEELCDEWRRAYFVDCRVKRDADSVGADSRKYNLIVVGDQNTNLLIKQMGGRLPLRTSPTEMSLAGRSYKGSHLGYEFISPNPLSPKKYVVVIGMNHWLPVQGWKLHPSAEGVYDYFVFDLHGPKPTLLDQGYFEAVWKRSVGRPVER
jgi:predicted esterase